MRYLLLAICLISTLPTDAQIYGKKSKSSITIFDSIKVSPGDTIFLGTGSDRRGEFAYIYTPPNTFGGTGEISLSRQFAHRKAVIKFFKTQTSKKTGEKTVAVVNFGGLNSIVDLEPAIDAGEIVAINENDFNEKALSVREASTPTTQVNVIQQSSSKADELKKLKELLDTGVLTEDEYNAEKKKILDRP